MSIVRFLWYAFVSFDLEDLILEKAQSYERLLTTTARFLYYWPSALLFSADSWTIINWCVQCDSTHP